MKVYVDKMPESCLMCKFYTITMFNEDGCMMNPCIFCGDGIPNDCELNLLSDHDKEVRKQVCDEIRESILNLKDIKDIMTVILPNNYERVYVRQPKVIEILDQIEKGE